MNKNGIFALNKEKLHYSNLKELIKESFNQYSHTDFYGYECEISLDKKKSQRSKKLVCNREFAWKKYNEIYNDVLTLKNYIEENKELFGSDDNIMIVIYANKSYQMLITILASMIIDTLNVTLLPIYDMIKADTINTILSQVKPRTIFVDSNCLNSLNQLFASSSSTENKLYLKTIILYEDLNEEYIDNAATTDKVSLLKYSEIIKQNHDNNDTDNGSINSISSHSFELLALTSIDYKLCRIKSEQLLITMNDLLTFEYFHYNQHDIYYQINSYADITEIVFLLILIQSGSRLAFCTNLINFYSSIEILHPTIMNTYPVIWKKIYMTLQNIILSLNEEQHSIVTKAIKIRMKEGKESSKDSNINGNGTDGNECKENNGNDNGIESQSNKSVWDKLVFDKIKVKFGSKVRLLFTSNDILNNSISQFIGLSLKAKIIQIYGTTETCGFISIKDSSVFHLGEILPSKQISIIKCPIIGYYSFESHLKEQYHSKYIEELCGEMVVKGKGLYEGYYNQKQSSIEEGNDNDSFSTGDYGIMISKKGSFDSIQDKINASKIVFIERISDFIFESTYGHCIAPLMIESSINETFNGRISNLFISKKDKDNSVQLVLVGQLANSAIKDNQDKMKQELLDEISLYIKTHYFTKDYLLNSNDKEYLAKNVYLIEKCEKLFSIKYKINRELLMKELTSYK